jgi:TnpA family transposase
VLDNTDSPGCGESTEMVESWNRANAVIFYGKGGGLASDHRDE